MEGLREWGEDEMGGHAAANSSPKTTQFNISNANDPPEGTTLTLQDVMDVIWTSHASLTTQIDTVKMDLSILKHDM